MYTKHFMRFARACPNLESVVWSATEEVVWLWEFEKRKNGRIKIREEARINLD